VEHANNVMMIICKAKGRSGIIKMERTTINIDKEVREALKKKRKFKRETYDEIINRELKLKIKGMSY
jgi:hypothetical protein